jgi:hypothetical protein
MSIARLLYLKKNPVKTKLRMMWNYGYERGKQLNDLFVSFGQTRERKTLRYRV